MLGHLLIHVIIVTVLYVSDHRGTYSCNISLLSSFLRKLRNQVWNLKEFFDFRDVLLKSSNTVKNLMPSLMLINLSGTKCAIEKLQ